MFRSIQFGLRGFGWNDGLEDAFSGEDAASCTLDMAVRSCRPSVSFSLVTALPRLARRERVSKSFFSFTPSTRVYELFKLYVSKAFVLFIFEIYSK